MNENVVKAKDGTEWVDMLGGLYVGRALDGRVRVCVTNGLPPYDPKASGTHVELQPEQFARAARFLIGPGIPVIVESSLAALGESLEGTLADIVRIKEWLVTVEGRVKKPGEVISTHDALARALDELDRLREEKAMGFTGLRVVGGPSVSTGTVIQPCEGAFWRLPEGMSGNANVAVTAICSECKKPATEHGVQEA